MAGIHLEPDGAISISHTPPDTVVISIHCVLHNYLDSECNVEVSFRKKNNQPTGVDNIVCQLLWRDTLSNDVIYKVEGTLSGNEDDTSSLMSRIWAMGIVSDFDIVVNTAGLGAALNQCDAFNDYGSVGGASVGMPWVSEPSPTFDETAAYNAVINSDNQPSYLVLPQVTIVAHVNLMLRLMKKLNIPLDVELDPDLTVDTAVSTAESFGFNDHRVQILWNPNIARPRDAVSLYGRKSPFRIIGQYVGKKLARNAKANALGIPPIHQPVAGANHPFTARGIEPNPSITLDEDALERLAKAKINVVQRIRYSVGTFFVVSDGLTQYNHATSALRLVNAAEITVYTENMLINICHRHLLKATADYLQDASRDIRRFLDACAGAGLLVESQDTGMPYSFKLTPDENYPFERVRLEFSRCPSGMVRSVIFDSVITK